MKSFLETKFYIISTLSDLVIDNWIESYPIPYKDKTGMNDCFFFYTVDKKNMMFRKVNIVVLHNLTNDAVSIIKDSFPENLQFAQDFEMHQSVFSGTGREYLLKYKAIYEAYETLRNGKITVFSLQKYINNIKQLVPSELFEKIYRKILNTAII